MHSPMILAAERLDDYEWDSSDADWLTIVRPDGRYQIRADDWVARNAATGVMVHLTIEPVEPDWEFHVDREWGAKAIRTARRMVPDF